MGSSPYFNNIARTSEQNLIDDLIVEAIAIKGQDTYYIPRTLVKTNPILGEDILNTFEERYQLEMWIKDTESFKGDGLFIKKFGLEIRDQTHLVIAKSRFNYVLGDTYGRPREGDLIFFPLTNTLFEIKYVTQESIFYQLGKLYVYEITCELFEYTHQTINTGVPEIDILESLNTFSITLPLKGGIGIPFVVDEIVYQGASVTQATATGIVLAWDSTTKVLTVKNVTGDFVNSLPIIAVTSGATGTLSTYDDMLFPNDPHTDNKELQTVATEINEFDANNPFGED